MIFITKKLTVDFPQAPLFLAKTHKLITGKKRLQTTRSWGGMKASCFTTFWSLQTSRKSDRITFWDPPNSRGPVWVQKIIDNKTYRWENHRLQHTGHQWGYVKSFRLEGDIWSYWSYYDGTSKFCDGDIFGHIILVWNIKDFLWRISYSNFGWRLSRYYMTFAISHPSQRKGNWVAPVNLFMIVVLLVVVSFSTFRAFTDVNIGHYQRHWIYQQPGNVLSRRSRGTSEKPDLWIFCGSWCNINETYTIPSRKLTYPTKRE